MRKILGFETLAMGLYTLFHIDQLYPNYLTFTQLLDDGWWGTILIVIGLLVIFARNTKLKLTGIVLMQVVWCFYFGVFFYEQLFGINNTEWILTLGLVITLLGLAWRGGTDGC